MPLALFLINTANGKMDEVYERLEGLYGIENTDRVYGKYDIIVRIEAENSKRFIDERNYMKDNLTNIQSILPLIIV